MKALSCIKTGLKVISLGLVNGHPSVEAVAKAPMAICGGKRTQHSEIIGINKFLLPEVVFVCYIMMWVRCGT